MPVSAERASKQGPSQDAQNKSNDHAAGTTQAPLTGSWVAYLKGLVGGDKKAPNVGDDASKKAPLAKDPKATTRHGDEVVEPKYADVGKQVYKDGASLGDVNQGYLANCYLIAAMGAIAMQRPDLIESMIKDNGDGTATVMLYTHDQALAPPGEGKATPVRVSLKMPSTDGKSPVYAKSPTRELWPSLIEKAYVVLYKGGDYQGANSGGSTTEAMSAMLGTQSSDFAIASKSDDELMTTLTGLLKSGKPVAAASLDKEDLKNDAALRDLADERQVYPWHAYVVKRVDAKAGVVELHNPWGSSHPSPLSVDDFRKLYQWVYVGNPKAPKGGQ